MSSGPDLIPFWLVSSFEYEYINEREGDVSFKIFTKWWWHSKEKLEIETNGEGGTFFYNETKSDCFPVNPSLPFLNLILIDSLGQLARAESKDLSQPYGDKKVVNFAQKVFRAKLRSKLRMKRYPFDRHLVPAILAVRQWRTNSTKHKWVLLSKRPEANWFDGDEGYKEDKYTVNLIDTFADELDELDELKKLNKPEVRILKKGEGKPVLCLKLERDPHAFFLNVAFPTFVTVSIVLMSCYGNEGPTIKSVATGVLTLAATQLALQEKLPKQVYITYAGIYLLVTYTFLFGIGIAVTVVERFFTNGENKNILDYDGPFWTIFAFTVIWGVLHLLMLLDIGFKCFRGMFRVSWEEIVVPEENTIYGELNHVGKKDRDENQLLRL